MKYTVNYYNDHGHLMCYKKDENDNITELDDKLFETTYNLIKDKFGTLIVKFLDNPCGFQFYFSIGEVKDINLKLENNEYLIKYNNLITNINYYENLNTVEYFSLKYNDFKPYRIKISKNTIGIYRDEIELKYKKFKQYFMGNEEFWKLVYDNIYVKEGKEVYPEEIIKVKFYCFDLELDYSGVKYSNDFTNYLVKKIIDLTVI